VHLLHCFSFVIQSAVTDEVIAMNVGVGHCCLCCVWCCCLLFSFNLRWQIWNCFGCFMIQWCTVVRHRVRKPKIRQRHHRVVLSPSTRTPRGRGEMGTLKIMIGHRGILISIITMFTFNTVLIFWIQVGSKIQNPKWQFWREPQAPRSAPAARYTGSPAPS
jgi:hypothetical protein